MAEKNMKARIVHKHDTESNWLKATSFIPKQGEIIVYDIDDNYSYERIKIGDDKTLVSALPFVTDALVAEINVVDDKIDAVSALVGDTTVSEQIDAAIKEIESITIEEIDEICGFAVTPAICGVAVCGNTICGNEQ